MTTSEFLNEYYNFVIEAGFSKNSADQYKSYLRNVGKKLPSVENNLDLIASVEDMAAQSVYVEQMNVAITNALKSGNASVSSKRLNDYRCAVTVLHAFVEELAWDKGNGAIDKPSLTGISEYECKNIKKTFLSRVRTQDRLTYPYGVFAARILSRISTTYKVKLFDKMIENIKFLVSPVGNEYVHLKDIDKLIITDEGYVCIEVKGKINYVYTEIVRDGDSAGYEKLVVSSIGDLSLDHDTPLYIALQEALANMPEYKKISDSVKKYWKENKSIAAKFSKDYYEKKYNAVKEDINETVMLKEMKEFLDNTSMTVMHKSYNSSKSKNII